MCVASKELVLGPEHQKLVIKTRGFTTLVFLLTKMFFFPVPNNIGSVWPEGICGGQQVPSGRFQIEQANRWWSRPGLRFQGKDWIGLEGRFQRLPWWCYYARFLPALVEMIQTLWCELRKDGLPLNAAKCQIITTKPLDHPRYGCNNHVPCSETCRAAHKSWPMHSVESFWQVQIYNPSCPSSCGRLCIVQLASQLSFGPLQTYAAPDCFHGIGRCIDKTREQLGLGFGDGGIPLLVHFPMK